MKKPQINKSIPSEHERTCQIFSKEMFENVQLFVKKHFDYGPNNVHRLGILGLLMRMEEKIERVRKLQSMDSHDKPINESLEDSLRDISNYATITLMYHKHTWPPKTK